MFGLVYCFPCEKKTKKRPPPKAQRRTSPSVAIVSEAMTGPTTLCTCRGPRLPSSTLPAPRSALDAALPSRFGSVRVADLFRELGGLNLSTLGGHVPFFLFVSFAEEYVAGFVLPCWCSKEFATTGLFYFFFFRWLKQQEVCVFAWASSQTSCAGDTSSN